MFFSSPPYICLIGCFFLFDIILDLAPLSEDGNRLTSLSFFFFLFILLFSLWINPQIYLLLYM